MNKLWVRFVLALIITLVAAVYQRATGPTYPLKGEIGFRSKIIDYKLTRSHGGETDQPVEILIEEKNIEGVLIYKKYKTNEHWVGMKMIRDGDNLRGYLPNQPPAGKLEYYVLLIDDENLTTLPSERTVITRFKGDVPDLVLTPHIFLMFLAMLFSTTAGLEALVKGKYIYKLTLWTSIFLFMGGMILGPLVQKFAFNEFWAGIPFGIDLTDNKTLIAMITWILALWKSKNEKSGRYWVIAAAIVLLLVYSIPHSMLGSELNYETMQVGSGD
jgi:hypothetical protein